MRNLRGLCAFEVMLALGYGCGPAKIVRLKAGDIDSAQNIIRMVQAKGRKDRHVMLPPDVLSLLRQWWKVRPSRYHAGLLPLERWLFPGRRYHQDTPVAHRQQPGRKAHCRTQ